MAKLLYQGHGSFRMTSDEGRVLYVDPFAGEGYDTPADVALVTHQHGDHNQLGKLARNPGCVVITNEEALEGGVHRRFSAHGFEIEAVEAGNRMHSPKSCVGYLITVDGVTVYASGDTSKTAQMAGLSERNIDYALYCCDGIFNMNLKQAAECAALVGAGHNIPIHMKPGALFDRKRAEKFAAPNRLIVEPGQEIGLAKCK